MAGGEFGYKVTRKDSTILDLGAYIGGGGDTIGTVLALIPSSESITELSATLGGTILSHDVNVGDSGATFSNNYLIFYDATPDPEPTYSIVKMYHNGVEYETGGGGGGGGHDYSWETKTITSGAVELGLRTIVEPNSNFTLNAPSDLQDGMEYVLRCVNGSTAYTLTLGTGFVNDFSTDLTLHANHSDQFTFVAVDGNLELQPEYALGDSVLTKDNTTSFTPTGDYQPATKKYVDDNSGVEYNSGEGISIGTVKDYSAMWGPCPLGFHIPTKDEWQAVVDIWIALGGGAKDGDAFGIALKLPFAGSRSRSDGSKDDRGIIGKYWSCSYVGSNVAYNLNFANTASSRNISGQNQDYTSVGAFIRPFKDTPVKPDNTWTKLYGTSIEAGGIFYGGGASYNSHFISMSSDGTNWITIDSKNVGANNVRNSGDTLNSNNCGFCFQWGNVYPFPYTGTVTTSSTRVSASGYGPGNYYYSGTFIANSSGRDTSNNGNLWGGVTGIITTNDAITNKNNKIVIQIDTLNPTGGQILNLHHAVMKYGGENVIIKSDRVFDNGSDDPFFLTLRYEGYYGGDWYDMGGPAVYCFSTTMNNRGLHYINFAYSDHYEVSSMQRFGYMAFSGSWTHNKITTTTS